MRRCLSTMLFAVLAAGCGSDSGDRLKEARPQTVTAKGVITRKGQPLPRVLVMCKPIEGKYGCAGLTDESGRFNLLAFNPDPGAVPGKYEVSVQSTEQKQVAEPPEDVVIPPGQKPPAPTPELPSKFASYETAQLTLEIPAGGSSDLKIELPE